MDNFFGTVGTALVSIFSGGLTGIIGVAVQRIFDLKNKRLDLELNAQKYAHDQEMRRIDGENIRKEAESRVEVATVESQARVEVSANSAFAGSLLKEPEAFSGRVSPTKNQGWALVGLDVIRGLVRPCLTVYLAYVTTKMYFHVESLMGEQFLSVSEAMELMRLIIGTVLYTTTTCVLWWFGTRNKQKAPKL